MNLTPPPTCSNNPSPIRKALLNPNLLPIQLFPEHESTTALDFLDRVFYLEQENIRLKQALESFQKMKLNHVQYENILKIRDLEKQIERLQRLVKAKEQSRNYLKDELKRRDKHSCIIYHYPP